ncbi:MAG: class I SAM-dependent methyltransferase [Treponema sp.]|jgi:2-polyprenyl-3-methyl-5-hydroxy-6-metoxy-1,4-benzoquinol methylase|nr:class I SAM-dependent methyltransferase [Treponema sp.]
MKNASILIVPACERGRGGGHLIRSLLILKTLQANGRDAFLWVSDYLRDDFLQRFRDFFNTLDSPRLLSHEEELKGLTWDFIVLDRFRTTRKEYEFFSRFAPVIGIDEGGPFRNRFDFLIDLLPSLKEGAVNIFSPALLSLPRNRQPSVGGETAPGSPFRILISFGAEDSAGLGIAAARSLSGFLAKAPTERPLEVTLVSPIPPHNTQYEIEELFGITVLRRIPYLSEHLAEYDLLVTHFGIGAFEAVYARLPVILVSPGSYHERLSKKAGFFSLGIGTGAASRLGKLACDFGNAGKSDILKTLEQKSREIADRYGLWENQKETIANFLCRVSLSSPLVCPVCKKPRFVLVLARFPEESYRQCPHCGIIYLARLGEPPIEYEKDYFFSDYKKQYGKTYLEDFPGLVETGKRRLEHIVKLIQKDLPQLRTEGSYTEKHGETREKKKYSVLDIGCAYGPFLAAAAQCGFSTAGVEPASDAARYVKETLGFPCYQGFFPAANPEEIRRLANDGSGGFDVVTLWYVIEHSEEVGKVLQEIHRLLKEGGVLAFSTPSFSGVSGRKSLASFLKNSPPDHYTVWSPKVCAWILRRYGFRLRKIVVTGHHPERFPLIGRFVDTAKKGVLYSFLFFVSRLFGLGDTFEVYAVKS